MSDEFKEIFQRLSSVEQEIATHIAVCGERSRSMDKALIEISKSLHEVNVRVTELSEIRSRVKGGYVLAVGAVFLLLELLAVGIAAAALVIN